MQFLLSGENETRCICLREKSGKWPEGLLSESVGQTQGSSTAKALSGGFVEKRAVEREAAFPEAWALRYGNPGASGQKLLKFPTSGEAPGVASRPEVRGVQGEDRTCSDSIFRLRREPRGAPPGLDYKAPSPPQLRLPSKDRSRHAVTPKSHTGGSFPRRPRPSRLGWGMPPAPLTWWASTLLVREADRGLTGVPSWERRVAPGSQE